MKEVLNKYQEGIKYLVFGVATTLVNWIVYTICVSIVSVNMTMSNAIAWFCAVGFAYITNRKFVFESRKSTLGGIVKEMLLFFGARALSGMFEIVLPTILYGVGITQSFLGIEGFVAKMIVSILVIVLNYFFSKLIIFKS